MKYEEILEKLLNKRFSPKSDSPQMLSDSSGAYLMCVKQISALPEKMRHLEYKFVDNLPVIYVGIAGRPTSKNKSIKNRDYKNHFKGNARSSTLRKSLGVLFGLSKKNSDNEINTSKYRFIKEDEQKLSEWMIENLVLYFIDIDNPMDFEKYLINLYTPPLNLKDNNSEINIKFREELSKLRNAK